MAPAAAAVVVEQARPALERRAAEAGLADLFSVRLTPGGDGAALRNFGPPLVTASAAAR
jgi:hypothetical protein